jgi:uncharacterized protein HemY
MRPTVNEREQRYLEMVAQFPESPLGYFTLGRYYLESERFLEAIEPLERCVSDEPDWTAALVALADAHSAVGNKTRAIELLEGAQKTSQASHRAIAAEIEEKLEDLRE